MEFSFKEYYSALLVWPLVACGIGIIVFLLSSLMFIKSAVVTRIVSLNNGLRFVFGVVISASLILNSFSSLKYGINLVSESESDAQQMTGVISHITDLDNSPRFYFEGGVVRGKILTINDQQLYFMTSGELMEGDEVTVWFLPKSTLVLEWRKDG